MRPSHVLGLLALLAALVVGGTWFLLSGDGRGDALAIEGAAPAVAPPAQPAAAARPQEPEPPPAAGPAPAPRDDRRAVAVGGPLGGLDEDEVDWIEGRLLLPAGAAWDESARVLSVAAPERERASRPLLDLIVSGGVDEPTSETEVLHAARVGSDGTFRVACAEGAEWAWLDVDARFLYLPEPQAVRLAGEVTRVELAPLLGASLEGRWIAPPRVEGAVGVETSLVGGSVHLTVASESELPPILAEGLLDAPGVYHRATTAIDGTFVLRGIDPNPEWVLVSHPNHAASVVTGDLGLAAGEVARVDVALERGVRLSGRVVERDGDPVPFATLQVTVTDEESEDGEEELLERRATSRGDGTFAIHGIAPGELRLRAEKDGYRRSIRKRFELGPGESEEGIEVTLRRGEALRGRVVWDDGTAAVGAVVQVGRDATGRDDVDHAWRTRYAEIACEPDGRFEVLGLKKRAQSLWASCSRERSGRWVEGTARLDGVEPSEDDELELVLTEAPVLAGTVRDAAGAPVTAFRLVIRADEGRTGMMGMVMAGSAAIERDVRSADGLFLLERLGEGDFAVSVEADGFATSTPVGFRLPARVDAPPLEIVLGAFASVSGIVVDPRGTPVPGAEVALQGGELGMADLLLAESRPPVSARANGRGEFTFPQVDPGRVSLVAESEDWVASAKLELELRPGTIESGRVLSLRVGASLTGELLDPEGRPIEGRDVTVEVTGARREMFESESESATTDANGWFELTGLVPGPARVEAQPDFDALRSRGEEIDWWTLQATRLREEVELIDGGTVHVRLGGEQPDEGETTRVSGTVTERGAPVAGSVVFQREPVRDGSPPRTAELGDGGAYEIELTGPADYRITVRRDGDQPARALHRRVSGAEEQRLDLRLPASRIAGRVFDPDGEPVNEVPMTLRRVGPSTFDARDASGFFGGHSTDGDGRYEFDGLEPGTYVVGAGSPMMSLLIGSAGGFGRTLSEPVTLGVDEVREPLDLRLEVACELSGKVRDGDGAPVNGASIFVYDASGVPVDSLSTITTNASGRFTYAGLAQGDYAVLARDDASASPLSATVRVRPGKPGEVELRVERGTTLVVGLVDGEGRPMRAAVSVVDERGHEVSGLFGFSGFFGTMRRGGGDATRAEVGPVASGRYRVTARATDGRRAETEVNVRTGDSEREVRLVLAD